MNGHGACARSLLSCGILGLFPALGYTAPGDALGPEVLLYSAGQPFTAEEIARDSDGDLVAVGGTVLQRYDANGAVHGAPIQFADHVSSSAVAMSPEGDFVAAWRNNVDGSRIFVRCFDPDGQARSEEVGVRHSPENNEAVDVAMDADGDLLVSWIESQSIIDAPGGYGSLLFNSQMKFRRYNRECLEQGPVQTAKDYLGSVAGALSDGQVTMNSEGGFAFVWSGFDIAGRSYFANGLPRTPAMSLVTNNNAFSPSIGMAGDGRFAVGWDGQPFGAEFLTVLFKRFGPEGLQRGLATVAPETSDEARFQNDLAMSDDGHLVLTWISNPNDQGINEIHARLFSPQGEPLTGEFEVRSSPSTGGVEPQVAITPAGAFTLSWLGEGPQGSGTYIRQFEGP